MSSSFVYLLGKANLNNMKFLCMFVIGGQYWRYRGGYGVDRGYPLTLNYWRNVQRPVDDVFQYYGTTYFFSGTGYQVFNDRQFRVSFVTYI